MASVVCNLFARNSFPALRGYSSVVMCISLVQVKAGRFDSLFRVKYLILANAVIATMQPPYPKTLTLFAEARQITEVCSLSVSATSEVNVDFSYVGGSPFATGSVVQEDIVEDLQLANYPRVAG